MLVERSLDAIALIERDGIVSYVSPPIVRVLGYTPEEFIGLGPFEAVHPDDRDEAKRRFAELLQEPGSTQTAVNRVRHKDGSWRWIETVSTNQLDQSGTGAVIANLRDVTDQTRAEEAVREAEEKFRFIVESATEFAIFTTDLAGRVESWNPGASRILGYEEEEVLGQDCRIFFAPEDNAGDQVGREMRNSLTRGHGNDERWHLRKGGRRFWASGLMMPLRDDEGNVRGYLKILRDMTREKRAEEALRESEARFRSMADSAPVMIWMADVQGRRTYFNKPWLDFTGRTPAEDLPAAWLDSVHPDDRERCTAAFGAAFEDRTSVDVEYRLRRSDGEYRWVFDRASPLFSHEGELTGYIGSGIDITDRKHAEEALKDADRRKNEFLAMLAHELRNPLAAINNAVQLTLRPGDEDNLEWSKGVIERQAKHLARLLDDLLDVARITQGKIQLRKEPLDLSTVIARAVEVVRPLFERRRHTLTLAVAHGQLPVFADPTRMEQILVNLLTNAAKYTEEEGSISLTAYRDGEIIVSVKDNGHGIPPEMLPRVFELFAQVDRTIDRSQGGLGIGLTLARSLVRMHGGEIRAVSEGPGKGSEFTIRLPVVGEHHPEPPRAEPRAAEPPKRGLRVLVVDDNRDTAVGMARLLKSSGYEVTTAHDGPTAVELARAERPDAILLDIGLPGIDGYEVARQIRNEEGGRDTLLIAVSGYGQQGDRERSRLAGFDHHLVKPVGYDLLISLLDRRGSAFPFSPEGLGPA
ncbi:MAG: PAS domain S-box protein [Isosphaeraceae bacterium]|nr:PAS domain S-box protein [Isosphaeraceae bacterium]